MVLRLHSDGRTHAVGQGMMDALGLQRHASEVPEDSKTLGVSRALQRPVVTTVALRTLLIAVDYSRWCPPVILRLSIVFS